MDSIKDLYTFTGIPAVFALIVVIFTVASCVGTILVNHRRAVAALAKQFNENKEVAIARTKSSAASLGNKIAKSKSSEKDSKEKEKEEKARVTFRNEVVEKATFTALFQVIFNLMIGLLALTILGLIF